jgi:YHS domain-containing protein
MNTFFRISMVAAMSALVFSCTQKKETVIEINKVEDHMVESTELADVKVDNKFDPICEMTTADHLSDTIHYKGKIIGFCSKGCKETFGENPEKYVFNMGDK